ncbi:HXXEE domain-containing protein [Nocardioides sp. CPCC 205120]|uniref:HXXEE domain-containing protein n=1 Tax=Nocardioides sp. CPCC 205120 TaxID=3406462 RepID=UPI003B513FA5
MTVALLLIAVFAVVSPGPAMWWTFIPAMVLACVLHLMSTAVAAPDPAEVLPIYLIALAWQFLHFAEEYLGEFHRRWPEDVFGARPMSVDFFVGGNMAAYAAFTVGALALLAGWRVPLLVVWFFAVMGVLGNAVGHLVYAIVSGDALFPGTLTSLAYWIIGPVLLVRLWRSSRGNRAHPDAADRAL